MSGVAATNPTPRQGSFVRAWVHAHREDVAAILLLLSAAVGIAFYSSGSTSPRWSDPDSLFYRANVLRIEGTSKTLALVEVFNGPLARKDRAAEESNPSVRPRVSDPAWVQYSSRFYERRWFVPLIAAALDPWFGVKGLLIASLLGYVLLAPFLYLLLRQAFKPRIAAPIVGVVLLLPTVRERAYLPMTDSWGLALECLSLALGLLVLRRGARLLPVWALAILALSITRDATVVPIAGALVAVVATRERRSVALFASGLIAALPALFVFGAPLRETMAYTVNDFLPAPNPSWGFVFSHYPYAAYELVRRDVAYLLHHPLEALVFAGGFISLLTLARVFRGARPFVLGAAICSLADLLVLPNYSEFRLELIVIPFSAFGLAALAGALDDRIRLAALNRRT